MKRYFTFLTLPDAAYAPRGGYHYMSLPGAGYVGVIMEESVDAPEDWIELPHLLDSSPAQFDGIQHALGMSSGVGAPALYVLNSAQSPLAGIVATDSTFQIAKKLSAINRVFRP